MSPNPAASLLGWSLAISTLGLLAGPLLAALSRGRPVWSAALDGLALGVVPLVLSLRLFPHVLAQVGWPAAVAAAAGYLLLRATDHHGSRATQLGRKLVYPALVIHALTDGAALAAAVAATGGQEAAGLPLCLALVVHRLPEGLFLATTLQPLVGPRATLIRIGGLALATVAGALFGQGLARVVPDALLDGLVAFGLGAMLRMVVHSHAPLPARAESRAASGLAYALGLALVLAMPAPHSLLRAAQPSELAVAQSLVPLFIETAPAALAAFALAALFGHGCGAPRGPGRAPAALGPTAAWLGAACVSWPLFGPKLACGRIAATAAALLLATLVAVEPPDGRDRPRPPDGSDQPRGPSERLLDPVAAWLVLGLVAAAVLEAVATRRFLDGSPPGLDLFLGALAGLPLRLCPLGATPLAAIFIHKGLSPGAAVTFLVTAGHAHAARGARRPWQFAVTVVVVALVAGVALDRWVPAASIPRVHPLVAHAHSPLEWSCAAILGALLLAHLASLGPRAWFAQLRR